MTLSLQAADDSLLPPLGRVGVWFNDPDNWTGPQGLLARIVEHLEYTAIVLVIAVLIALPLGLLIGHTGRGVVLAVGLANAFRAIPTLGLVILLVGWLRPLIEFKGAVPGLLQKGAFPFFVPVMIVLVLLALPPILTSTYAGVKNVDPAVRDAAKGMGMTGWQVVRKVEIPNALPLIASGIRSATLQVIATLTVAAYLPFLGGLGRFIKDGTGRLLDPRYGYPAMVAAGLTVALLAVAIDGLMNLVQRAVVSPGVSGRFSKKDRTAVTSSPTSVAQVVQE
ncbi:ABC transporter permease [Nakamurella sp. A5-74]|uniref:ABC transporter permease n=1 Tax=Nakamurella sp. A5-74 TaxID=3158264 RepID=A0AAU8DKI4_9ACTN